MPETADMRNGHGLRAGVASVDITPKVGVQVAGAVGAHRPANLVADPTFAKALVLESDGQRLCLVAADLTIITGSYSDMIRDWAQEELGIERSAVMIHATQTHSAPAVGSFLLSNEFELPEEFDWVRGSDAEYNSFATDQIMEAIRLANDSLQVVDVGYASGIEGRMAFNRRAVGRDGRVSMPGRRWKEPLGPTEILYMEGPIDPEVGVICFRGKSLRFPAVLVNYSCHPVHVFPKPIISPDWPGALSDEVKALYGEACVPLVINGPCGNVNPWPPFDPDYVEDHKQMGRVLARTVEKVVETLTFSGEADLDWRAETLKIPIRQIDPQELEKAQELLNERPKPVWTDKPQRGVDPRWVMSAGLIDLRAQQEKSPTNDYEIQAFRIGEAAIVGLPGEPFVEGGLRIKMASPTYPTYVAHDVNHYAGYLPIKEAFGRGGHETSTGNWSRFIPEALDIVVEAVTGLLKEMFPQG